MPSEACNFAYIFEEEQKEIANQCRARGVAADLEVDGKPGTPVPDRLGIAFSGGGIRSACVAIGIMQSLARVGILKRAHYLSAVSGGSYAMSWLTAWTQRSGKFSAVENRLGYNTVNGSHPQTAPPPQYQRFLEPDPLHYLRKYSSYLTPRMGLLSGDTLAAISIYVRNLLLNQVMLVAALISITLLLQRIAPTIGWATPLTPCMLTVGVAATVAIFFIATLLVWPSLAKLTEPHATANRSTAYVALGCAVGIGCLIWMMMPSWYVNRTSQSSTASIVGGLAGAGFALSLIFGKVTKTTSVERHTGTRIGVLALAWAAAAGTVYFVDLGFRSWLIKSSAIYVGDTYVILALPAMLIGMALVSYLFIGLLGDVFPDCQREWLARFSGYLLAFAVGAAALLAIELEGPAIFHLLLKGLRQPSWEKKILTTVLPGGWLFVVMSGLIGAKSANTPSNDTKSSSRLLGLVIAIAPPVFLAGLLIVVAWGTHWLVVVLAGTSAEYLSSAAWCHPANPTTPVLCWTQPFKSYLAPTIAVASPVRVFLTHHAFSFLWIIATSIAALLAWRLDVNEFSMHLFYRNRLVRAFAGASNPKRVPSPFTGFAPDDDIALSELTLSNSFQGPYPIWGTTLNLTAGEDLAWQQRMGASFIYSPLFCGWDYVDSSVKSTQPESPATDEDEHALERPTQANLYGYRRTMSHDGVAGYGGLGGSPYIGTAMAASGAAASPNMGFHTKPSVAALLAIFNVRLGWWTGNPRNPRTWNQYAPGIWYLLSELLGRANDDDHYVYLSDGGHFENLGLYELIRRKVRFIICSDADADPSFTFGDLGNAVERCRADFGVEIRLGAQTAMKLKGEPPFRTAHYAVGEIIYPGQDARGLLLYLKSSLTDDEPSDVLGMRAADDAFPHDSTADQFFDESMFEAYRALGAHMIDGLLVDAKLDRAAGLQTNIVVDLFRAMKVRLSASDPRSA